MYYLVTFEYAEGVYCTNIAHAETQEAVEEHYANKYAYVYIRKAKKHEVKSAIRKGMPVVMID